MYYLIEKTCVTVRQNYWLATREINITSGSSLAKTANRVIFIITGNRPLTICLLYDCGRKLTVMYGPSNYIAFKT